MNEHVRLQLFREKEKERVLKNMAKIEIRANLRAAHEREGERSHAHTQTRIHLITWNCLFDMKSYHPDIYAMTMVCIYIYSSTNRFECSNISSVCKRAAERRREWERDGEGECKWAKCLTTKWFQCITCVRTMLKMWMCLMHGIWYALLSHTKGNDKMA